MYIEFSGARLARRQRNSVVLVRSRQSLSPVVRFVLDRSDFVRGVAAFKAGINSGTEVRDRQKRKATEACSQLWHVPSRRLVSRRVERRPGSSSPPKLRVRARRPLEASRNLIVTGPVLWHFEKSEDTRNLPSCSSGSCRSSVWFVKSPRISRPICASRAPL